SWLIFFPIHAVEIGQLHSVGLAVRELGGVALEKRACVVEFTGLGVVGCPPVPPSRIGVSKDGIGIQYDVGQCRSWCSLCHCEFGCVLGPVGNRGKRTTTIWIA